MRSGSTASRHDSGKVSTGVGRTHAWRTTVVAAGKLKSTDGVYGIRFAHNTEATVTGLTMTRL
jgi:hypothetical protein